MKRPRGREAQLSTAVAQAVASGTALVNSLDSHVLMTFRRASSVAGSLPERDALEQYVKYVIARHRDDIGTFRVVLFGRTGAGKSSLVEALTGGDGRSISTGESDYTTQPRSVGWGPLELIDTPGIAGWGRTASRESLESTAAGAVARADLVLLCFDDQNQQASEFDVVHREIQRYGRTCIAVLNVRNPRWGESGPDNQVLKIERQVAEHAAHLRRELDLLGFSRAPIVAINTQRAVAARATDQYAGPDANQVRHRRLSYGIAVLEDLSNLTRLESLLANCLSDGAPRLRAKAVEQDILGRVSIGAAWLQDRASQLEMDVVDSARVLVAGLAVIGSGDQGVARPGRWSRRAVAGGLTLAELEHTRPDLLSSVRSAGSLQRAAADLISIHVAPHRGKLQEAAERVARGALDGRTVIDGAAMMELLEPAIEAAETDGKDVCAMLAEEFSDQIEGLRLTVTFTRDNRSAEGIDGTSSNTRAKFWTYADLGIAGGIGAVFLLASNPVGWVAVGAGAVVSIFTGWRRRRAMRAAEARTAKVRVEAVAAVRRTAESVYLTIENDLWAQMTRAATDVAVILLGTHVERLVQHVRTSLSMRLSARELIKIQPLFGDIDAWEVLQTAEHAVRRAAGLPPDVDPLLGQDQVDKTASGVSTAHSDPRVLENELKRRVACWLNTRTSGLDGDTQQLQERVTVGILGTPGVGIATLADAVTDIVDGAKIRVRAIGDAAGDSDDCDVIVWLLSPNISLAGLTSFDTLLGDHSPYRSTVLSRSVFVVTRIDQLGPDLLHEPAAVADILKRKGREVADLMAAAGCVVDADTVLFVAPMPFGLAPDYSVARVTGISELAIALSATSWSDRAARDRHRLIRSWVKRVQTAASGLTGADAEIAAIDEVLTLTNDTLAARQRHMKESESRLRAEHGDVVDSLAMAVCAAPGPDQLKVAVAALKGWPGDSRITASLEAWQRRFLQDQEDMSETFAAELADVISRRSWSIHLALGDAPGTWDFNLGATAVTIGRVLKSAGDSRDGWYALVKFVTNDSFKFKPWGAIKGAKQAKALGSAVAIVGVAVTALEIWLDKRASEKRRVLQQRVLGDARRSLDDVLNGFFWQHGDDDEPGLFTLVEADLEVLRQRSATLRYSRESLDALRQACADEHSDAEAALVGLNR